MKMKALLGLVMAVLAGTLLVGSGSGDAYAAGKPQPFAAYGLLGYISEGTVAPAGNSGRFVVQDRLVLGGLIQGSLTGPLSLTYGTNVPILTQSGQVHGKVEIADGVYGNVSATIAGESSIGLCEVPVPPIQLPPYSLVVHGTYALNGGLPGNGTFSGCVWAEVDGDGHIVNPLFGVIQMNGKWNP